MSDIILRPRQLTSIQSLRDGIKAGHRAQILMAGTGAGKTIMGTHLIKEAVSKMRRAVFLCDRIPLINQTSKTFDAHDIDHGVLQADHWRFRPHKFAQVCSIQTVMRRGIPEGVDLVIVDEAHTVYEYVRKLIETRPDCIFVGLSATPFTKGLGKLYTNVVNAMTTNDLIEEGWLTPLVVYIGRAANLEGVHTNTKGEWSETEVAERNLAIVGDIVAEWVEKTNHHFGGPVKTIGFSASVADGSILCDKFKAAGFRFEQISYRTPDDERDELMKEFQKTETDLLGLVSVEALAKGFDQADIKCGIDARPLRKSLSGDMQMRGRVMRPLFLGDAPDTVEARKESMAKAGKPFALWMDHSGNFLRFKQDRDEILQFGLRSLSDGSLDEKVRPEPSEEQKKEAKCKACGAALVAGKDACPACGALRPKRSVVETVPGKMERFEEVEKPLLNASTGRPLPDWMADKAHIWEQLCTLSMQQKQDPVKAKKLALAQYRGFYGEWPAGDFSSNQNKRVDPRLESKCHQAKMQYFKRSKRA